MRRVSWMASMALLAGCLSDDGFVDKYVEAECELLMTCYDEAVLNFLGWSTVDDCIAQVGQDLVNETDGCTYDRKAGSACVKEMKDTTTCPADGEAFEPPAICNDVFVECPGDGGDTGDTADTADTPHTAPTRKALIVPESAVGERLDRFLQTCLPELTRSAVQRLIEEGQVMVNSAPSRSGYKLRSGDAVRWELPAAPPAT